MYVLFNAQHQILIEEEDLLTQKKIYYFASPAKVKAVNSYSNKTAKIIQIAKTIDLTLVFLRIFFK